MTKLQPRSRPSATRAAKPRARRSTTATDLVSLSTKMDRQFDALLTKMNAIHLETTEGIRSVQTNLASLSENVFLRFRQIDDRLDTIDDRLDRMDGRFDRMDGRFDRMDSRFDALEARIDQSRDQILDHLGLVYQELTGRLGDVEAELARHRAS